MQIASTSYSKFSSLLKVNYSKYFLDSEKNITFADADHYAEVFGREERVSPQTYFYNAFTRRFFLTIGNFATF